MSAAASHRSCHAEHQVVLPARSIRRMYTRDLDWVSGGQYQELWCNVRSFVGTFRQYSLRLVLFFDGGVDEAKLSEWANRRKDDLQRCERSAAPFEMWAARCPLPLPSSKATRPYRTLAGPQVFFTAGEADREMARYAVTHGCAALLGHDSDFFVLPVPRYLVLGTLDLRSAHPTAVATKVNSATTAARWIGPSPVTPILWTALDFEGRLDAHTRDLIARSLEQYLVDEDVRCSPAHGHVNKELMRRFRLGQLDSAVFTASTKRAIWRGPCLSLPAAKPPVLASRPLRAEMYSLILSETVRTFDWEDVDGGRASLREGERKASTQRNGEKGMRERGEDGVECMRVSEFLVYSGKQRLEAAEEVQVPEPLACFDEVWRRPPLQRLSTLLLAFGRACGPQGGPPKRWCSGR
ncbi:MAG: hypothetical protein SGPRY_012360 [Prymnesium sp.]